MEEWVMATCATPGLVTISPNIRLCRHKSVAVARGVALVKPDEPFLVKVCNFGTDQAIVRKNSILGFAEPFQGPMLAAITEEKATQDTATGEDTSSSDDQGLSWINLSWIYPRSTLLFVLNLTGSCVFLSYSLSMRKNILVLIGALLAEYILVRL